MILNLNLCHIRFIKGIIVRFFSRFNLFSKLNSKTSNLFVRLELDRSDQTNIIYPPHIVINNVLLQQKDEAIIDDESKINGIIDYFVSFLLLVLAMTLCYFQVKSKYFCYNNLLFWFSDCHIHG